MDKSLDFIAIEKRYNAIIHILDKGQGIYEAMNIGLKKCSSEYTLFLNSGDYFHDKESLKHLSLEALDNEIVYGSIAIKDKQSDLLIKRPAKKIWYHKKYQHNLPYFPACLIKTELLLKEGGFREDMRISSDVDMLSKLALNKSRFKYVNIPITIFDKTGISSKYTLLAFKERIKILFQTKKIYILSLFRVTAYSYIKSLLAKQ